MNLGIIMLNEKEVLKDNIQHDYLLIRLKTTKLKIFLLTRGKQGNKEHGIQDHDYLR